MQFLEVKGVVTARNRLCAHLKFNYLQEQSGSLDTNKSGLSKTIFFLLQLYKLLEQKFIVMSLHKHIASV